MTGSHERPNMDAGNSAGLEEQELHLTVESSLPHEVSRSLRWLCILYVAEAGLELPIIPPPPPNCYDYRIYH